MFERTWDVVAAVNPERVWLLWADPERWREWNPGIARAEIKGAFVVGATGTSHAPGGPPSPLELISVDQGRGYATRAKLPATRVEFHYALDPVDGDASRISCRVRISGIGSVIYRKTLEDRLAESVPRALSQLAAQSAA